MSLPDISEKMRVTFHQASQVLQSVRIQTTDAQPNALRHSLTPMYFGATTGRLGFGGHLDLNYLKGHIIYRRDDNSEGFHFNIEGESQKLIYEQVREGFLDLGKRIHPDSEHITHDEKFYFEKTDAAEYAEATWKMYSILARVKGRFNGYQTPLVLWPHGFDFSTMLFKSGNDEHNDPHLNLGFSPGTPDVGQPYVYLYVSPTIPDIAQSLPDILDWHTEWSTPGALLTYDKFAHDRHPSQVVVQVMDDVYAIVRKYWDTI